MASAQKIHPPKLLRKFRANKKKAPENLRFAALATDVALFAVFEGALRVLLVRVNTPPHFVNVWGLPGGLIRADETADEAARRVLKEKGAVKPSEAHFEQLYTFSGIRRDPRNRVVSVAYLALLPAESAEVRGSRRNPEVLWSPVSKIPRLAYDHSAIVKTATDRLRGKIAYTNIARGLLPKTFTLTELQYVYETVLGKTFDKRNFRRKAREANLVKETGVKRRDGAHRPAEVFAFAHTQPVVVTLL